MVTFHAPFILIIRTYFPHLQSVKRPPQGEVFEWSVNQNLNELVLDELFHVALNLRVRIAYEMDQRREVSSTLNDMIAVFGFLPISVALNSAPEIFSG